MCAQLRIFSFLWCTLYVSEQACSFEICDAFYEWKYNSNIVRGSLQFFTENIFLRSLCMCKISIISSSFPNFSILKSKLWHNPRTQTGKRYLPMTKLSIELYFKIWFCILMVIIGIFSENCIFHMNNNFCCHSFCGIKISALSIAGCINMELFSVCIRYEGWQLSL